MMMRSADVDSVEAKPRIVFLHWLGGSARSWSELSAGLSERGFECIALDLPGFGGEAGTGGFDVGAMRDAVISKLQALPASSRDRPWLLAGHSMGGKVACVVARAIADGLHEFENLKGLVLFSPSPPSPEPMKDSKRKEMLEALGETSGDDTQDRKRAKQHVTDNTGVLELPGAIADRSVEDVLRMNRTAFRMWLEQGSREDWSERVGLLPVEAIVFAGSEEQDLGEEAQRALTLPHLHNARLMVLEGAGHLIPLERPREATEYICEFATELGITLPMDSGAMDAGFANLMRSSRTSPQTRRMMETRLLAGRSWQYKPQLLSLYEFRTLRVLAACVVPNAGFDLAALMETQLAHDESDGWRFADLPPDTEAWRLGLRSLDAASRHKWHVPFVGLDDARAYELIQEGSAGNLGKGLMGTLHIGDKAEVYTASQMKQWLEDVRSEFAKVYMAYPATMARIGFTGFADENGFTQIRIGEREEFER